MADIRPFLCIRPREDEAAEIAALPYDVYNREEAKKAVEGHDKSFLRIDRAETQFDDSVDTYAPEVYKKAHDMLWDMVAEGDFVKEEKPCYYIYELTMDGRVQTGITAWIFLAYRSNDVINAVVEKVKKTAPLYDFVAEDGIGHRVYRIAEAEDIAAIEEAFAKIKEIYIADGHHRAASAVKVGLMRRAEHPDYDGTEEFNYFLSVLFPDDQLMIMDYNRVVKDLNGMTEEEFLGKMNDLFEVGTPQKGAVHPTEKGSFSMYLGDNWYACRMKEADLSSDPVDGLDVSILQNVLLHPVLGIEDPKTDKRIDFVGGIRGLEELERRVHSDCKVAFAMYPTSIGELFAVADAGRLMPPKSTWFEPKLRSGLFIHALS